MAAARAIPEGLASMTPGPALAAVLASIDVSEVSGFDAVVVLKARYRQVAYEQGQLFGALVEVGLRDEFGPEVVRMESSDEYAADEIRAALALTRSAATWQLEFAERVVLRLPVVHEGMLAGVVDWAKAQLLTSWTLSLWQEHARKTCDRLVPLCGKLTTGQIREKLKSHATALDPDWAQRRYEAALLGRRVVGGMNEDGTANLSGYGLPPDRVRAACARMDALARRAKREGDRRPIDYIKVELFLGMTDGTYEGLSDEEILVHLALTRPAPEARPEPDAPEPDAARPDDPEPDEAEPGDAVESGKAESEVERRNAETIEPTPTEPPPAEAAPVEVRLLAPVSAERRLGIARREPPRHDVELRVRLSTLLNMDEFPAELAGHGPIHPAYARDLAADLGAAQWRYVLTDEGGRYVTSGLTTARPPGSKRRSWRSEALVELQIPITLLAELLDKKLAERHLPDPTLLVAWAAVVGDIARRTDMQPGAPPGGSPQHATDDPRRRFPGAALRRAVQIRKRRCLGPGEHQISTVWAPRPGRGADGKPWPQSTTWAEPEPKPVVEPAPEPPAPKPPPTEPEIPPF